MIQAGIFRNLAWLEQLSLPNNKITKIQTGTFENLPRLKELYLLHNKITTIQTGTFAGLYQLKVLYLSFNKITNIHAGTFSGLPRLQKLYLINNKITIVQAGIFANLSRLEVLYLSYNQITTIESGAFPNVPQLQTLILNHNKISVLPLSAYSLLASIPTVDVGKNPWQCDCKMARFRLKMDGSASFESQMECAKPPNLFKQKLKNINPQKLICIDPVMPVNNQDSFVSNTVLSSLLGKTESKSIPTQHSPASTFPALPVGNAFGKIFVSVCGSVAGALLIVVIFAIWWKKKRKNPPSDPSSNTNTTAAVTTSGNDQTGQGQSLATTQSTEADSKTHLNIKHPSHARGPAVPQPHNQHKNTGQPDKETSFSRLRKTLPEDDDEPTYVEPDGALYMTAEDVLYEMPANSHCKEPERIYSDQTVTISDDCTKYR
ncbi:uncharacterized protein LOC144923236 [Branchiostoma floridae x Branchiostoma belcheri]